MFALSRALRTASATTARTGARALAATPKMRRIAFRFYATVRGVVLEALLSRNGEFQSATRVERPRPAARVQRGSQARVAGDAGCTEAVWVAQLLAVHAHGRHADWRV